MRKPQPSATAERRAHVRYAHTLRTSCRLLGREAVGAWTARVTDVSRAGVGLRMGSDVKPGAVLVVALEGLGGRFHRPLLVRVANARPTADGGTQAGCTFVKPLTDADLQALLLAPSSA